jgi:hypothetical protein
MGGAVTDLDDVRTVPKLIRDNIETFLFFQQFHDSFYTKHRSMYKGNLRDLGIDTSHPNFQAWIDLGK